jgi:pimeloyl-ACP methyl ester carboxylesterase
MSAMVGCLAALQHPLRFSKLVLLNASPRCRLIRSSDIYRSHSYYYRLRIESNITEGLGFRV